MTIRVLLPTHLFPGVKPNPSECVLVEDPSYFTGPTGDFKIHKGRLAYLRAACSVYAAWKGIRHVKLEDVAGFVRGAAESGERYVMWDPLDSSVRSRWTAALGDRLTFDESHHGFVVSDPAVYTGPIVLKSVLTHCQRETGLMDGVPSTDESNRKPPDAELRSVVAKRKLRKYRGSALSGAIDWARSTFPDNPGDVGAARLFPHTRRQAVAALDTFAREALPHFGPYQDAVLSGEFVGVHSGLAAAMNVGLLHPLECAERAVAELKSGRAPINSVEAYVRQVLGWREYVRLVYVRHGAELERKYFDSYPKLGDGWYATDGRLLPLASAVRSAEKHAFLDHIQRLMVVNSLAVMAGASPGGLLRWFTELVAMDAHQWAMVGNIAHMSAMSVSGRALARRPYVSSSTYLTRMTDHPRRHEWTRMWDALYYAYLEREPDEAKYYRSALNGKRYTGEIEEWRRLARAALRELANRAP